MTSDIKSIRFKNMPFLYYKTNLFKKILRLSTPRYIRLLSVGCDIIFIVIIFFDCLDKGCVFYIRHKIQVKSFFYFTLLQEYINSQITKDILFYIMFWKSLWGDIGRY